MTEPIVQVDALTHRYGERRALQDVTFEIAKGDIFGFLGPNGGGKTTLFRLLSTLLPVQSGSAAINGASVADAPATVRRAIGVTFQSPSLDIKLTVRENLVHQGHLYGLRGQELNSRIDQTTTQLGVADRLHDFAEELSGGLKRRVEIAKSLLHEPRVLLLDEPSTGLDPGARHDLWKTLFELNSNLGVTILVTTHLMEEAEKCGTLGILDQGQLIARGTPDELRSRIGGDSITVVSDQAEALAADIEQRFQLTTTTFGDSIRIEHPQGYEFIGELARAFPDGFRSLTLGKPTLEDVFIGLTGRSLVEESE